MPVVSRMVEIDGRKYLDGGVTVSIPLAFFGRLGYDRRVVVLTQPAGYRKQPNRLMPLVRRRYRAYPRLVEAMANRHNAYNAELDYVAREEAAGRAFVIRPAAALPVRRVEKDPANLRAAYEAGRAAGQARLGALKEYLGQ